MTQETSPTLHSIKQTAKNNLKNQYNIPKSVALFGVVAISDAEKRRFVIEGLSAIGMSAVVLAEQDASDTIENIVYEPKVHTNDLHAFDFFIFDNEHPGVDVVSFMKAGIVPIMPEKNVFSGMLRDFNPMKFEGNGFFFSSDNPYCIFQKLVAYTENIKFPEDRRVLLKNVAGAF